MKQKGKRTSYLLVTALITALLTACQIGAELAPQTNQAGEAAVWEAFDQYHDALNAVFEGDLEPMQAVWSHADDVTYMGPDGAYRMGWTEVLADWETQAALNLGGRVEPDDVEMTVGQELAVVHSVVEGANVNSEGNPQPVSLRATVIFRQEAGAWKVIAVHTDLLPHLGRP